MCARGNRQCSAGLAQVLCGALLLLCSVLACNFPTGDVTKDEVKRISAAVWAGSPATNPPLLSHDDWQDLEAGDAVKTGSSGEAELALVNCTGHVYVFRGSDTVVAPCRKDEFDYASSQCLMSGFAWFNQVCTGRFVVGTSSAVIQAQATAFSVGYLPDEQLTLVMVFEDSVVVQPVLDVSRDTLGPGIAVQAGWFLYTMPGEISPEIAGLPARQPLPLAELPPLVEAIDAQPWIDDITRRAGEDGVLPPNWPPEGEPRIPPDSEMPGEPGGPAVTVVLRSDGGPLTDSRVQEALLTALNKDAALEVAFGEEQVAFTAWLGDSEVDARLVEYNPDAAREMLAEAGYPEGLDAVLAYPEEDEELTRLAGMIAQDLKRVAITVDLVAVPGEDMDAFLKDVVVAGEPVVWLARRYPP